MIGVNEGKKPTRAQTFHKSTGRTFPSKPTSSKAALAPDLPSQPRNSLSANTESTPTATGPGCPPSYCELKAIDSKLEITFPSSQSNFEVWDQDDELFLVGPLSLHLTLKDPTKWDGTPIHPGAAVIEIRCTSKAIVDSTAHPYYAASAAENNKYSVQFEGARMRNTVGEQLLPDPTRGIAIDGLWISTYTAGELQAPERQHGWKMHFYIPIASRLFKKCETRAFQVEALISVWGETLVAQVATMSVSHLMREREMVPQVSSTMGANMLHLCK
ncbi:hypothetical protein B0H11DRAFT_1941449 [Mycena galericulata]|nr:hypothetical protein B0H11DRAFT_1941449 [Mycena galericulata]